MPLKLSDATVSSCDHVFAKLVSEAPTHRANFILFLANKDPSTTRSCKHMLEIDLRGGILSTRGGFTVLIRWENNTTKGHLEDHEAHLENKMKALLSTMLSTN